MKFLESIFTKILDFMNFGRLITIVVPGIIVSFFVMMLCAQLLFPQKPDCAQKCMASTATAAPQKDPVCHDSMMNACPGCCDAGKLFQAQLSKDFSRTAKHVYMLGFLTIILGILLYELGYWILSWFKLTDNDIDTFVTYKTEDEKAAVVNPQPVVVPPAPIPAAATANKRFDLILKDKLSDDEKNMVKKTVLEYFAPFLKEKFSGDENYFNFLVLEYYRFVEFSVIMPVAAISSSVIGLLYWILFGVRNGFPHPGAMVLFFLGLIVGSALFIVTVSKGAWKSYQISKYSLIKGVSDMMTLGLTPKS